MPDRCSLCGTLVETTGTDEGTMHYRPVMTPQEARLATADRLEYVVMNAYRDGEISEGVAMWALGLDRLSARVRLRALRELEPEETGVKEIIREYGPGWRDEAARRYAGARDAQAATEARIAAAFAALPDREERNV